jgi:hypothetical protein
LLVAAVVVETPILVVEVLVDIELVLHQYHQVLIQF